MGNRWITLVEQVQLETLRSSNDIDNITSMLTRFLFQNVLLCRWKYEYSGRLF